VARHFATIQNKTANSIYGVGYPVSTALPMTELWLCLSEVKHAHTDDEVRQEMA
jgi:hypothetical protein